jgi:catechol 2,3-dioxygenase-like lactoylglutathione lyase family enzyme
MHLLAFAFECGGPALGIGRVPNVAPLAIVVQLCRSVNDGVSLTGETATGRLSARTAAIWRPEESTVIVKGVNMCMVFVSDMDTSVAWYTEVLELPLVRRHNGFAVFDTGNVPLALHQTSGDDGDSVRGGGSAFGSTIVFEVSDYGAAKLLLESRGCNFVFENEQGGSIFGSFADPDGNPLQILQPPSPSSSHAG